MKRGAEKQISKGDDGDDEIEEIQEPQGFQRADESTLGKRQIRALPRRALAGSRPPSINGLPPVPASDVESVEAVPQPKFGGFGGFGAASSTSSSFTFTAQPPVPSLPAFDTTFKPAQSASPFLGQPKPVDVFPPKPAISPSVEEGDAVAFKYFKSLRGLNVSFLSAISAAVEKDPFCDVANLVESYKNLRTTIQSEFDGPPTSHGAVTTNAGPTFGTKAPPVKAASPFTMPKPPSETSSKLSSTDQSATRTGGFTFPPFVPPSTSAPTQLPFDPTPRTSESSRSPPTTTPEPPKPAFTFATSSTSTSMLSQQPASAFSFAASRSTEDAPMKSIPSSSSQDHEVSSATSLSRPSSTAPSLGSSSVPNFFATTKPASIFGPSDSESKPTSAFNGPVFGGTSTTNSSKLTPFNPPPFDGKESSKTTTTLFGNVTAASSSAPTNIFRPSEKPVGAFGSAFQTGAFGGKPGGSIGNPVGFGFGSPAPGAGETTASGLSNSGFTFGAPATKSSESLFSPPMTDKSSESTPQPEAEDHGEGGEGDGAKLLPSHTHDEEGEGEEDEETTHAVRCKVYRLFKSDDKNEWKDFGIGMLRLKKHKETNVRRVLMRNSNTGRILINFRVHGSLKPTLAKTAVSFVGYENSIPTSFTIRVKTEEQAKELKQAMEREIASVQSTE